MTDQPANPRRMTARERREQVLDLAHGIIDADGFHAATLNRIASEAGVSRTVIYQQFGDLAGLLVALVDREALRAAAQFDNAIADLPAIAPSPSTLELALAGVLQAIDERPATWRLFLLPAQGGPPELHDRIAAAQTVVRAWLQAALLQVRADLPDPEYTARILHAAGAELLRLRLRDPNSATKDRILKHARQLALALLEPARVMGAESAANV